jgi:hypothetical protein
MHIGLKWGTQIEFDKKIIENLKKIGKTEKACSDADLPCFMWGLSV